MSKQKREQYDAFGFSKSEMRSMQGAFGGSGKSQGLPPLQLNLIDMRPAKVKYRETKKRVDSQLENMRYERKLKEMKRAEDVLEREHPTTFVGYAKKGGRTLWEAFQKRK
jgi:hypothetical protein